MNINVTRKWAIVITILVVFASAKASTYGSSENYQSQLTQLGLGIQAIDISNFYEYRCDKKVVPASQANEIDYLVRQVTGANNQEWLAYLIEDSNAQTASKVLAKKVLVCDQNELEIFQSLFAKNVTDAIHTFRQMKLNDQFLQFPEDQPPFTMDDATRFAKDKLRDWHSLPQDEIRDLAYAFSLASYSYDRYRSSPINPKSMDSKISVELFEYLYQQTKEPSLLYDIAYAKLSYEPNEAKKLIEKAAIVKEKRASYGCDIADMKYIPYFKSAGLS